MKRTKLEACRLRVNDSFAERLDTAFEIKFPGVKLETRWNLFAGPCGSLVSVRADGRELSKEQHTWVSAYSDGYGEAMGQIWEQAP